LLSNPFGCASRALSRQSARSALTSVQTAVPTGSMAAAQTRSVTERIETHFPSRLVFLLLAVACAHPPRTEVLPVHLDWLPFYWVSAAADSISFEHAGIIFRVPLRAGSPPSLVQLDLAASGGLPDGLPEPAGASHIARPEGQLYGILGARGRLSLPAAASDSSLQSWRRAEIGTVGLPNYIGQSLVLDFVRQRFCVIHARALVDQLAAKALAVIPLPRGQYDRIELGLVTPSGQRFRALLDTGLSPFPLWTTRSLWQELTGLTAPGPRTRIYRLPNPRGDLVFVGAPVRPGVQLESWKLPVIEAVFLAEGPAHTALEAWQPPIDAILGPSLFAGRAVVLVDFPGGRLAFLPPSKW